MQEFKGCYQPGGRSGSAHIEQALQVLALRLG